MGNPTDPNAGTNRTNAVSRDNLMNGMRLKYDGHYSETSLNNIGLGVGLWSINTRDYSTAYNLVFSNTGDHIYPQSRNNKYFGFGVRCATQRTSETFVRIIRHNQVRIIYT